MAVTLLLNAASGWGLLGNEQDDQATTILCGRPIYTGEVRGWWWPRAEVKVWQAEFEVSVCFFQVEF